MHVAALVQGNFFTLEVGHGLNGRILGHQQRFSFGRSRFLADVDEFGAGGLRKDERRFADKADIGRPQVKPF